LLTDGLLLFWEKEWSVDRILNELFRRYKLTDEDRRAELADAFYHQIRFWRPISTAADLTDLYRPEQMHRLLTAAGQWKRLYTGRPTTTEDAQLTIRLTKFLNVRRIRESIPDWLDELGEKELGEERWNVLLPFFNQQAPIFLRVNTLRTTRDQLQERLFKEGIETVAEEATLPDALRLIKYQNVFRSSAYTEGWFEVQDRSSQRVAVFADIIPGMRIVDACAGNGGKSLHMAARLENKGRILAFDTSATKLENLRKRAARAGIDTIETRAIESAKVIKRQVAIADRLLLDVPCSGTGVLRRNPDIRWRLQANDISRLHDLQRDLLERYSPMVKPGGKLIYATCSALPSEGEVRIDQFLKAQKGWKLEKALRTDPISDLGDDFFMASLVRLEE
jgi:16S rRNA (cytosine967-C5)-methyltransferase